MKKEIQEKIERMHYKNWFREGAYKLNEIMFEVLIHKLDLCYIDRETALLLNPYGTTITVKAVDHDDGKVRWGVFSTHDFNYNDYVSEEAYLFSNDEDFPIANDWPPVLREVWSTKKKAERRTEVWKEFLRDFQRNADKEREMVRMVRWGYSMELDNLCLEFNGGKESIEELEKRKSAIFESLIDMIGIQQEPITPDMMDMYYD